MISANAPASSTPVDQAPTITRFRSAFFSASVAEMMFSKVSGIVPDGYCVIGRFERQGVMFDAVVPIEVGSINRWPVPKNHIQNRQYWLQPCLTADPLPTPPPNGSGYSVCPLISFCQRKRYAGWFKLRGGYLIKQRLKLMVVKFVNDQHIEQFFIQIFGKLNAGKSATYYENFFPYHHTMVNKRKCKKLFKKPILTGVYWHPPDSLE